MKKNALLLVFAILGACISKMQAVQTYGVLDRTGWEVVDVSTEHLPEGYNSYRYIPDGATGMPEHLFDGNASSTYFSLGKPIRQTGTYAVPNDHVLYFVIDLKSERTFNTLNLSHRTNQTAVGLRVHAIGIYGCNDLADSFETIVDFVDFAPTTSRHVETVSFEEVTYRYLKIVYKDWSTTASASIQVSEINLSNPEYVYNNDKPIKFFDRAGWNVSKISTDTISVPGYPTYSYVPDTGTGSGLPADMFDGSTGTFFSLSKPGFGTAPTRTPAGHELYFVVDMGKKQKFDVVRWQHRIGAVDYTNLNANRIDIYGSNDMSNFDLLIQNIDLKKKPQPDDIVFDNVEEYQYLKFVYKTWAGSSQTLQISELYVGETFDMGYLDRTSWEIQASTTKIPTEMGSAYTHVVDGPTGNPLDMFDDDATTFFSLAKPGLTQNGETTPVDFPLFFVVDLKTAPKFDVIQWNHRVNSSGAIQAAGLNLQEVSVYGSNYDDGDLNDLLTETVDDLLGGTTIDDLLLSNQLEVIAENVNISANPGLIFYNGENTFRYIVFVYKNWSASNNTIQVGELNIGSVQQEQTITFDPISDKAYGDADFAPGATTTATELAVTYTSSNLDVAIITEAGEIQITGVGNTDITASQAGNAYYLPATPVTQTLTVVKGTQTITFDELEPCGYAGSSYEISPGAAASSGLVVTYTSSNPAVVSIEEGKLMVVGFGSTEITASQAGNENYEPATPISHVLIVSDTTSDPQLELSKLSVYPTTVGVNQTFEVNTGSSSATGTVSVYTALGVKVNESTLTSGSNSISAPSQAGLYLVKVTLGTEEKTLQIIVK